MTDREKLLISLLNESDRHVRAGVRVLEVVAMLERIGRDRRRDVRGTLRIREKGRPERVGRTRSTIRAAA